MGTLGLKVRPVWLPSFSPQKSSIPRKVLKKEVLIRRIDFARRNHRYLLISPVVLGSVCFHTRAHWHRSLKPANPANTHTDVTASDSQRPKENRVKQIHRDSFCWRGNEERILVQGIRAANDIRDSHHSHSPTWLFLHYWLEILVWKIRGLLT